MYTVGIDDIDSGLELPQALGSPTDGAGRPDFLSTSGESTPEDIPCRRFLSSAEDSSEDQPDNPSTRTRADSSTASNGQAGTNLFYARDTSGLSDSLASLNAPSVSGYYESGG